MKTEVGFITTVSLINSNIIYVIRETGIEVEVRLSEELISSRPLQDCETTHIKQKYFN